MLKALVKTLNGIKKISEQERLQLALHAAHADLARHEADTLIANRAAVVRWERAGGREAWVQFVNDRRRMLAQAAA